VKKKIVLRASGGKPCEEIEVTEMRGQLRAKRCSPNEAAEVEDFYYALPYSKKTAISTGSKNGPEDDCYDEDTSRL